MYNDFLINNSPKISGVIICGNWVNVTENEENRLISSLNNTLNWLKKHNLPVIVIGQNETYILPYQTIAAKEYQYKINVSNNYLVNKSKLVNDLLLKNFSNCYVNIYDSIKPKLNNNNIPYMTDANHYSKYGADLAVNNILSNPIAINLLNLPTNKPN